MAKQESVEALLNPSLRVSRPVAACARCRSAKIKCDGKLPACSACEKVGKTRECSSANDEFAKGKERSYVAALETTIERLQRKINEAKAEKEDAQQYRLNDDSMINRRPSLKKVTVSGSKRREASNVDELVSDFGFLTVNATSRDFHGFTSIMSFSRLLMACAAKMPLPQNQSMQMPSRYTITPLVDHYFKNIYVLLPFFSETAFMGSLSKVYQDSAPITPVTPHDQWYVRLVLAISAASTCKSKGDANYEIAMTHVSAAMKVAEHVIHPGSVVGIQALLLLVQYSLVDPEHFDSWYLIGMASRLVVDLGLHSEPPPETKLSKQALDLRRRVFYCTYALDRQISMALGFAFSFTDDSAPNVLLPTLATDLEKRSPTLLFLRSIRPSLFLFDIRRVQSAFYQATRSASRKEWTPAYASDYISGILNDVRSWHASLPSTFEQRHLQFFYIEFLYSQLLTVSPNQNVPVSSMSDVHKALVFHLATQYADQMLIMVQNVDSQAFLTFADICRTKFVGRQFQDVLWSGFDHLLRNQHALVAGMSLPSGSAYDNCSRAITFLNKTTSILDFARTRWDRRDLRERFEQETAVLLARLQNKLREYGQSGYPQNNQQDFGQGGYANSSSQYQNPGNSMTNMAGTVNSETGFGQMSYTESRPQPIQMQSFPEQSFSETTPAMHRSNLLRPTWSSDGIQNFNIPPGTMPRRSYEFLGNTQRE